MFIEQKTTLTVLYCWCSRQPELIPQDDMIQNMYDPVDSQNKAYMSLKKCSAPEM